MRPKGLTEAEIEKFANFEWDDSEDEEMEREEEDEGENVEEFIEKTLQDIDKHQGVEVGLIEELLDTEENAEQIENIEIVQEVFEKTDLATLKWSSTELLEFDTNWKSELCYNEVKQPVDYFTEFFADELWEKIRDETNLYALQKKGTELKCTVEEVKKFVGILLYLAVVKIPTYRMAWSQDFKLAAVANALPRSRFEKIKQFFHLNNNTLQPQKGHPDYDKLYKVRPLFDFINKKFNEIPQEEYQSIDEQMIAFKGQHSLKQYLPMKPHKWGFKMFTRAGVSGIIYDFTLYIGDGTCKSFGLGISSDIVLHLSANIPRNQNFKLFFDNWFTSISLMIALRQKGILAVGTVRSNRLKNCALSSEKELQKRGRGSSDFQFEERNNLIACRWYDNKSVQLVSNYVGKNPVSECKRWCRKDRKYVSIPRPGIVDCYNKHMGGVDLADMLLELYRINHRSNKWYMRLVYWCINSAVVNSWLLYRRDVKNTNGELKHMSLIKFQLDIANELLNASQTVVPRKRGRPSLLETMSSTSSPISSSQSSPAPSKSSEENPSKRAYVAEPPRATRFDMTSHWPQWGSKGRCRLCRTGCPRSKCSKCNVYLCCNPQKNCFVSYHT